MASHKEGEKIISLALRGSQRPLRLFAASRRCNGMLVLWHKEVRTSLTFLCVPKKSVILVKISAQSFIEICVCEPRPVTAVVLRRGVTRVTSKYFRSTDVSAAAAFPRKGGRINVPPVRPFNCTRKHVSFSGCPLTSKKNKNKNATLFFSFFFLAIRITFTVYGPHYTVIKHSFVVSAKTHGRWSIDRSSRSCCST